MRTYSHVLLGYLLARRGVRVPRRASLASAAGAALPDIPAIVGAAVLAVAGRWSGMPSAGPDHERLHEQVLDQLFFTGPVGTAGLALHSAVPVAGLLLVLALARGADGRRSVRLQAPLWFLLGWAGHVFVDFLTHAEDSRPPLWPLSDWRWQSPVSYWNPDYFGVQFTLVEHAAVLLALTWISLPPLRRLLSRTISRRRSGRRSTSKGSS